MWCYFVKPVVMFKKVFYSLILLSAKNVTIYDKIEYLVKLIAAFAPVAVLLELLDIWYKDNEQFCAFVLVAILINMGVGIVYHVRYKTFSWKEFFSKNISMMAEVIVVYVLLEMIRLTFGGGAVGESLKVVIQIATLLRPTSKALKNIYILTEKKHPPSFIMERLYNFEKNGNIDELVNPKDNNEKTE